jgi:hypothetical protein
LRAPARVIAKGRDRRQLTLHSMLSAPMLFGRLRAREAPARDNECLLLGHENLLATVGPTGVMIALRPCRRARGVPGSMPRCGISRRVGEESRILLAGARRRRAREEAS